MKNSDTQESLVGATETLFEKEHNRKTNGSNCGNQKDFLEEIRTKFLFLRQGIHYSRIQKMIVNTCLSCQPCV